MPLQGYRVLRHATALCLLASQPNKCFVEPGQLMQVVRFLCPQGVSSITGALPCVEGAWASLAGAGRCAPNFDSADDERKPLLLPDVSDSQRAAGEWQEARDAKP